MTLRTKSLLSCAGIAAILTLWVQFCYFLPDPDRLYHLAISREVSIRGPVLTNLPQAEDIGWGRYFPEKEFLHHAVTGLGFKLGKDSGALAATHFLTFVLCLLAFVLARQRSSPFESLFLVALFLLMPYYLWRAAQMKPFVSGVACVTLLLLGLLRRSRWMAAAGAFLFPLFYHLLPMPAALIACFAVFEYRKPDTGKLVLSAIAGLAAGVVVNPYFPSNLITALQILWIGWNSAANAKLDFGMELLPLDIRSWLVLFLPPFLLCAWAIWKGRAPAFLRLFTALLWAASFVTQRTLEYALPLSIACVAWAMGDLKQRARYVIFGLGISFFLIQHAIYFYFPAGASLPHLVDYHKERIEAVRALPLEPGLKVFHCGWETGSYVFYLRPDLRFVDLLDPSYLYLHDRVKWEARQQIRAGGDPVSVAKAVFGADFFICDRPIPGRTPLYRGATGMVSVYDLR